MQGAAMVKLGEAVCNLIWKRIELRIVMMQGRPGWSTCTLSSLSRKGGSKLQQAPSGHQGRGEGGVARGQGTPGVT